MSLKGAEYIASRDKERFDRATARAIMATTFPLGLAVAMEAMVEHRTGNPFFTQERVGKGGKPFSIYKFQSLPNTDHTPQLLGGSNHPAASKAGVLIRRTGLDELPQLINVLKGDMSMVGFRASTQECIDHYEAISRRELFSEWYARYILNVGVTGESQLTVIKKYPTHTPAHIEKVMEADIRSFDSASLRGDMQIVARTPFSLLRHLVLPPANIDSQVALQSNG